MKISRRQFIKSSTQVSAAALLSGGIGLGSLSGCSSNNNGGFTQSHPNILLIMVDQMQTPPAGYRPDEGAAQGLKEILGFRPLSPDNAFTQFFPGLLRLRQNAVVLKKHYTASSACVPSRACIMTGQYSSVTGVDQTDGLFKTPHDVPFLDPAGIPTIGDWLRAVGYTTHYFGKWHVSEASEETQYLTPWGFSDWGISYPDAHAGNAYNSGTFRDVGLGDNVVAFLNSKGTDASRRPWFAVGSILNPHDCSIWPINWQTPPTPAAPHGSGVVPWSQYPPVPSIPAMGEQSLQGTVCAGTDHEKTMTVDLNPDGFPQNSSTLPRTYTETLNDKPRCQKDYALKWGLAFAANTDYAFIGKLPVRSPLPFQLQADPAAWSQAYNQFYFYCHYLADLQIRRMLKALDDNGLDDNTIVVFLSDHGDLTGAHGGMIQKWHNAYEEAIRVPMVISSPLVNKNAQTMREILQPTSSIDFAPTVLALAGYDEEQVSRIMKIIHGETVVKPFAGADLSSHIQGASTGAIIGPDGKPRTGAFFMSTDTITELGPSQSKQDQYDLFLDYVKNAISAGHPLAEGSVRQPNNVRALCTGDWKIVHYVDPRGIEGDEWELYCLITDPIEQVNLVNFMTGEVRGDVIVPGFTIDELKLKNAQLKTELAKQEAAVIV
ncbi:MAG: sulfatase-like hydrolase/transferase [Deltaproteobacteria bacterium]